MPPLAAADAFLVLEFVAGNRHVPHPVFAALLAALPSVSRRTSPRLRKGVALRALDAALSGPDDSDALLLRARAVLADPDVAACFPDHLVDVRDDVAALRRLVDAEWASLPPSALELSADRIAGAGALHTWDNADQETRRKLRLLVGESTEREILSKLGQGPSQAPGVDNAANAPSTSGANEADNVQQDDDHLGKEHEEANHAHGDCALHRQEPVQKTMDARLPEKSVASAAIKRKDQATSSGAAGQAASESNKSHPVTVGESTEREVLSKLVQDPSQAPGVDKVANAPSTSGVNEADNVQQDDDDHLGREHGEANHGRGYCSRHQQEPVQRTVDARLPDKLVTSAAIKGKDQATSSGVAGQVAPDSNKSHPVTGSRPSLIERKANATVYEWDGSSDSDSERPQFKRRLPTYERKMRPPPEVPHKTRKKWTEMQERTLVEGVEKYGKGRWKDIKIAYPDVFEDRSTVDMKDKFRNMGRY